MTQAPAPVGVDYISAQSCPLCTQQAVSEKTIYGHPVCRKCYSAFVWRRLGAYMLDSLIMIIPSFVIGFASGMAAVAMGNGLFIRTVANIFASGIVAVIFSLKDGLGGASPGKMILELQVLDNTTGRPISFVQSAKRNSFILLNIIPFIGWLPALVIVLIIAFTLGKGYRLGDAFANTKVIWKRFATSPVFQTGLSPAFEAIPATPGVVPAM